MRKRICVIDGQGGGIGSVIVKYLKESFGEEVELIGLGTNAVAAAQMLRAGANKGASGENAICRTVMATDLIVGPISVGWANSMLGEVTPKMAEAVASSSAMKVFMPLYQENMEIVGITDDPLPHLVSAAVERIKEIIENV